MTVFFATLAIAILLWFSWQLFQAKRFTRFKKQVNEELKPKVIAHLRAQLEQERCEIYPNTDSHIEASIAYWSQYPVRIVQLAFAQKIIDQSWLEQTGNIRPCQHLYHVQHQFKAEFKLPLLSDQELLDQEHSNQADSAQGKDDKKST